MQFGILGPLQVTDHGQSLVLGPRRQRQLLATLLANAGRAVSLDELIDSLWGVTPPAAATSSIQVYVSNLRRVLEPARGARAPATVLVTEPPGYALRASPDELDAQRFERAVTIAAEQLDRQQFDDAIATVDAAMADWRGSPLADFTNDQFAVREIERLNDLRAAAQELVVTAKLAQGDVSAPVMGLLERLVAEYPRRERARGLLMVAYYRSGRQVDALQVFDDFRDRLVDELGLEPGPELRAIQLQVLTQDPGLTVEPFLRAPGSPVVETSTTETTIEPDGFVGRHDVLDRLAALATQTFDGRARFALIGGEPGIGKTKLLEHFGASFESTDALVSWGRCHEDAAAPPLWPWAQVLRRHERQLHESETYDRPALAAMLPELGTTDDLVGDPDVARFRLFDAIRASFEAAGNDRPLVVVLDDLQWADASSLRLLRFLATERLAGNVLVVALFHEPPDAAPGSFGAAIADLARLSHVERFRLAGLTLGDVMELVRAHPRVAPNEVEPLAATLHQRTNGNAFFVTELLRLLDSGRRVESAATDVPEIIADVVRRRVQRLPEHTQAALRVGAVIGHEFTLDELDGASGLEPEDVFAAMEIALVTGMIVEIDRGRYRFVHGLVADTLYHDLSATRRARLHLRVAGAMETLAAGSATDEVVTQLARHYRLGNDREKLLVYADRAASVAERTFAFDEAAAHLQVVLDRLAPDADTMTRVGLLVRLARALRMMGFPVRSCEVYEHAAEVASTTSDPSVIAMAATAFSEVNLWQVRRYGEVDDRVIATLEKMLAALPQGELSVRAQLLIGLAESLYYRAEERPRAMESLREAVSIATSISDDVTYVMGANELLVFLDTEPDPTEALRVVRDLTACWEELSATVAPRQLMELTGWMLRAPRVLLSAGDVTGLSSSIVRAGAHARLWNDQVLSAFVGWARASEAFLEGRYDDAEREARLAYEMHSRLGIWGADETAAVHHVWIWREQGRLAEMAPQIEPLLERADFPRVGKLLAYFALDRGDLEAVAHHLGPDPVPVNRDFTWLVEMCVTADQAAASRHPCAQRVYDELLPFAGRVATMDATSLCAGSVSYYLGLLARSLGEESAARRHFHDALEMNERIAAVPWVARTKVALVT